MPSNRHLNLRRRGIRQLLKQMIFGSECPEDPKRGRLLLESLERRQLLAGDIELLFTDGGAEDDASLSAAETASSVLQVAGAAEGEAAPDLVQFAKDLAAAGVKYFGAAWCPFCTEQKELFADGGHYLPFIEVTNGDRTLNSIGQAEQITTFPTWEFPDETRETGVLSLETLSQRSGVPIPQSEDPTFAEIGDLTVQIGSPLHIPVDAYDPNGGPLTVTVSVSDPSLLEAVVLSGNRSIRIDMQGYGDMIFELFEQRAETAAGRVIQLAEADFYDGIIFHRVADDFVIQGGDPTGTGTSGSSLGNFDDDFHPELQHNREGVLSFAKSSDDTNNSQFFITEVPTRFLDYNHSVFGQLVEGFDVRESISETSTPESRGASGSQKPDNDITIDTIEVFNDIENSVVMLKPTGAGTGTTSVTFTVTDSDGNSHSETVQVAVVNDTANSQPYLNDIVTPSPSPSDTPAQLQLSSVDIEGDAVTYFAQSLSASSNGTVSVNPNTGLLTVDPADGFAGSIDVRVGVRPGPGVTGNSPSDSDTQVVTFTFEADTLAAPTSIDLQAGSDSGLSNSDNVTNVGTLSFLVSGVTSGASVELVDVDTNTVVGTGLATGTTIVITTSNIAALGDGTYQIAARQRLSGNASSLSPTLTLTYDTAAPDSVVASAATQANVGRAFETDLISSEEGSGLRYALSGAPAGATISSLTGMIQWTPTASQTGDNTFTVELTDLAGNQRSEQFTVNVDSAPTAEIRLEVTDLNGNPLSSIDVGDEFLLRMIAGDLRESGRRGIYGAYADILFDSDLVRPVPGSTIDYPNLFALVRKGTFEDGQINELGAVNASLAATNDPENLIATVRMEAIGSGTVNLRSEPADDVNSEFLMFGIDNRIPPAAVEYGSVSLAIGQNFTVQDDEVTIAEDSGTTTIDVLQNDEVVSGDGSLSVVGFTQPSAGGVVSLDNGVISFTPEDDFNGTAVFTYRVSDEQGIQESASVTVTVSPVNDPPVGVNDTLNVEVDSGDNFLDVLANDTSGPDTGETLVVTDVGSATTSNGGSVSVASNGSGVIYRPAAGFIGTDTFTYTVSDGTADDTVTVNVTVTTPDNPPTAVNDSFDGIDEDDAEASFDPLANDTRDVDNQEFLIETVGTPSDGGSVRISNDGLEIFYEPADDFEGTETVTYTIRDTGGGLSVGTMTFTVNAVNDPPPIAEPSVPVSRDTSDNVVLSLSDLPTNVDDGETLTLSVTSPTAEGGVAELSDDNSQILYTPPVDFVGTDTISYTVADGTGLTTSGTITVQVNEFSRRQIQLKLPLDDGYRIEGVTLLGNDVLGNSVEMPIAYAGGVASFDDVLPGDYTIRIPAIPFLQGGSEPQEIQVRSEASEGDEVVEASVGRLRPEFVSIRDWLGSTPRQAVLAVVEPGQTSLLAAPTSEANLEEPTISLDEDGEVLTVIGTRSTDDGESLQSATLPTSDAANAEFRGEVDGMRLYRIRTDQLSFEDVSSSATASAEGESPAADALTLIDTTPQAEGEQVGLLAPLTVGDIQAESESVASSSVTEADLFVPVSDVTSTRTDATVLPLDEGDLWVGESLRQEKDANGSFDSQSIDTAMEHVAEELTAISKAGDTVAEQAASENGLQVAAIDEAISSEI